MWVEGVGVGSLVFHWILYSPPRGEKEKRGGGVPLAGHNRRKPARGIPQAALTHRLEVSGATLCLTAALQAVHCCPDGEFHHFYILHAVLTWLSLSVFNKPNILILPGLLMTLLFSFYSNSSENHHVMKGMCDPTCVQCSTGKSFLTLPSFI